MLQDRSWLDGQETRTLIAAFDAAGLDLRFVGGVVRDALLGRSISDIDLATPARPDDIIRAVSAAGLKAVPTGIAHGTVTALVGKRHFEITTLRRDIETDGRHAVVVFTDDWREDASRRDFTMNALYADRDGTITDFFGGVSDGKAGLVRFIGEPSKRIAEDALRILRFFRFHAWYGAGEMDADGMAACAAHAPMIDRLSGERVRDEVFKLLRAPDPVPVWRAMLAAGIAAHIAPSATEIESLKRLIVAERELGLDANPLRRFAALIGTALADEAVGLKARLKLSNADAEYLAALPALAERLNLIERGEFARALYGAHSSWVRDAALLVNICSGKPEMSILVALQDFIATWREPLFPLTGDDLTARGLREGPQIGRLLSRMEDWWLAAGLAPNRHESLAELDRMLEPPGDGG
jgi:poly(A) polymerase